MAARLPKVRNKSLDLEMVHETLGEYPYDYYPLGKHIVAARGVCGGRPTVKYRRLDARHIIGRLNAGDTVRQVARNYRISLDVVTEAIALASVYNYEKCYARMTLRVRREIQARKVVELASMRRKR